MPLRASLSAIASAATDPDVNGRVCTSVQYSLYRCSIAAMKQPRDPLGSPAPAPRSHGGLRGRAARPPAGDPAGGRKAVRAARLPRGDDPPDRRGGRRAAGAGGLLLRPEARALPRHLRALGPLDRGAARRPARGPTTTRPTRARCRASSRPSPARCWPCAPAPRASTTRCWWRASSTTRPRRPTACCARYFDPLADGLHRRAAHRAAARHARPGRLGLPVRARRAAAPPDATTASNGCRTARTGAATRRRRRCW